MQDLYPKSFGKYLLTKRVAVGGMAEVFKAKLLGAKGFEKTLAIKRILPEYSNDEEFVSMFVDEARISSNLHHKNIVQVFEFGEVNHQYYLTMEFIDGCNLKNLFFRILKQNRYLSRELIYYIILKTASALDYAHKVKLEGQMQSMQLVHRDVSPQNILISKMGDVKITDFGIAKAAIKLSQTQPGKIQGKYSYMSPEQALGKNINYRSDIFSLGIVFYELLTAKKVYGSSETIKRYSEATKANIPRIGTIINELPSQVDTLITRMVSKNPEDRPKDCTEVIDTLTEFLASSSDDALSGQLGALVSELFPEETMQTVVDRSAGLSERSHIRVGNTPLVQEAVSIVTGSKTTSPLWKWGKRLVIAAALIGVVVASPWLYQQIKPAPKDTKPDETVTENVENTKPVEVTQNQETKNEIQEMELQLSQLDDEIQLAQTELEKNITPEKPKTDEGVDEATGEVVTPPPPPGCPDDMVTLEGGDFLLGSNDAERNELTELTARKKNLSKFCIDKYEFPNQRNVMPTRTISWSEARDACEKVHKRLCSENEWERACKGPWSTMVNQQYPYGAAWKINACNVKNFNSLTDEDKSADEAEAGGFPDCVSSEGVYDLTGNLQEWTSSKGHNASEKNILKGGSYLTPKFQSRCSFVREEAPTYKQDDIGFRCCKDL